MHYEITDTFGGEANYSWVQRGNLSAPTKRGQVREIKRLMGITGQRCQIADFGDLIEVRPVGRRAPCVVAFLTWPQLP